MKANTNENTTTTATTTTTASTTANDRKTTFDIVKRTFETAYANGTDYTAPLMDLSTAIAYSVLNKCIDPQRKTAKDRDAVSDSGINPALVELKRGIGADRAALSRLAYCSDVATRTTYNADGDEITEIADSDANNELNRLVNDTLSDGLDLVNAAALAILEQASEHADNGAEWLDKPHTVRRLSRRVYIKVTDSAAYREEETTPIQEVYRAVRKVVQDSRATSTDPRNGYSYIEELTPDGLDTIYYRMGKYTDLGGYNSDGLYTTDRQAALDYAAIVEKLQLSDRQAVIVRLRMQGNGYKAIASYLGVTFQAVQNAMKKVQAKAEKIGFTPEKWLEMCAE